VNKDSENNIAGPDPDSEHVHDSNVIHELLMDIDSDSDGSQVDTRLGGIPGGIHLKQRPRLLKPTIFSNNQLVIARLIKNRNKLPEGALSDDVLDTSNTTPIVSIGE
jgi:hypothetical protein